LIAIIVWRKDFTFFLLLLLLLFWTNNCLSTHLWVLTTQVFLWIFFALIDISRSHHWTPSLLHEYLFRARKDARGAYIRSKNIHHVFKLLRVEILKCEKEKSQFVCAESTTKCAFLNTSHTIQIYSSDVQAFVRVVQKHLRTGRNRECNYSQPRSRHEIQTVTENDVFKMWASKRFFILLLLLLCFWNFIHKAEGIGGRV
jgi:hypothetical protein